MKKPIDLLMFDLDGTLAATGRDLANSVNYIRATLGLDALDDAYVYSRVGYGTEHLLRQSLPNGYEKRFEEILDRFLKHYEEHLLDTTVLYPHVKDVLERFRAKKKAVVTNKRLNFSVAVLRGLGIESAFDVIVGGDCGLEKKPGPGSLRHVLDELNVPADKALMIGDGEPDIKAGKAAGVHTCAVTYGLCNAAELLATKPDFAIADLNELADYIE
ncbi:MAG TPA: HAD-IA family hydrolase [Candidatus Binatia bacterium]|jgi:phosphoglycolate phosphatase